METEPTFKKMETVVKLDSVSFNIVAFEQTFKNSTQEMLFKEFLKKSKQMMT